MRFLIHRRRERQFPRMQTETPNVELLCQSLTQEIRIRPIAENRVADGTEVHTDLMSSAGVEIALEERGVLACREHAVRRLRLPGLARMEHRHLRPVRDAAADWRVDGRSFVLWNARDEREVGLLHRSRLELPLEEPMRCRSFRDEETSRRLFIQAMDKDGVR